MCARARHLYVPHDRIPDENCVIAVRGYATAAETHAEIMAGICAL